VFDAAAWLVDLFFSLTHNYALAIALVAVVIMLLITPLTLKSTKGMLEMQTLQPEMRRLQQQYKNDRQKLNEEMMKLYQEHKVNPLASCLPLLAQMPIFIIMFRVLNGLTRVGSDGTFDPDYLGKTTELYQALDDKTEMLSIGLNFAETPLEALQDPAKDDRQPNCESNDVGHPGQSDAVPARSVCGFPAFPADRTRDLLRHPGRDQNSSAGLHHKAFLRQRTRHRSQGSRGVS
jgi:YidC/Oxa1 family membrane protein insertase